ncbi:hypothetical protein ACFWAY_37140 [Rhodococcus sp. NPDC059968]|uniref:hypothetical protein n=1 Tax=Rhodococcus sp. NPDC059968 TaxID=3347017 RepID=UPI003671295C
MTAIESITETGCSQLFASQRFEGHADGRSATEATTTTDAAQIDYAATGEQQLTAGLHVPKLTRSSAR